MLNRHLFVILGGYQIFVGILYWMATILLPLIAMVVIWRWQRGYFCLGPHSGWCYGNNLHWLNELPTDFFSPSSLTTQWELKVLSRVDTTAPIWCVIGLPSNPFWGTSKSMRNNFVHTTFPIRLIFKKIRWGGFAPVPWNLVMVASFSLKLLLIECSLQLHHQLVVSPQSITWTLLDNNQVIVR